MGHPRSGVTLVEVLVALAILATLMGLLIPAVVLVRQSAATAFTFNQMRGLGLATQHYAGIHPVLPSVASMEMSSDRRSVLDALLPMLGEGGFASSTDLTEMNRRLRLVFVSPADPTSPTQRGIEAAATSFAANAVAFGNGRSLKAIVDGTSNTIAFGQHYRQCGETTFSYYEDAVASPLDHRATFADGTPFTDYFFGAGVDVTASRRKAGRPTRSEPAGHTFQHRPALGGCAFVLPQGLHRGGMGAAMMDGSVRLIAPTVAEHAFWSAVTPNGREATHLD